MNPLVAVAVLVAVVIAVVWLARANRRQSRAFAEGRQTALNGLRELSASATKDEAPVAIVTGANSGVGFQLAIDLVSAGVHVVLACRNPTRGNAALKRVLARVAGASASLLLVDVSDPTSLRAAVKTFRAEHERLDLLFCNAGLMPSARVRPWVVLKAMLCCRTRHFLETGRYPGDHAFVENPVGWKTKQGLGTLFATHVLGHYMLVHALEDMLQATKGRVVWTGSRAASDAKVVFDKGDWQHLTGSEAYGCTKFETDLLNAWLNDQWTATGSHVRSLVACPGFVKAGTTPALFRMFVTPMQWFRPLFPKAFHIEPKRGALVLSLLAVQDLKAIDVRRKHVVEDGKLVPAQRGAPPCPAELVAEFGAYCSHLASTL